MASKPQGKATECGARQETILREIDKLQQTPTAELRQQWVDLMGAEPNQLGRNYLIRRLAYRIQELAFGGLARDARALLFCQTEEAASGASFEQSHARNHVAPGVARHSLRSRRA